jgi:hypothetical protein
MRVLLIPVALSAGCLVSFDPCDPEDDNLLGDADFSGLTCWYDGDEHDWDAIHTTDAAEHASPESGLPVLVAVNEAENARSDLVLQQGPYISTLRKAPLGLTEGDRYAITFWAKSDPPRTIEVFVGAPTRVWSQTAILITSDWTEHTTTGQATGGAEEEALFEFQFGGDAGITYIDDVTLVRTQ